MALEKKTGKGNDFLGWVNLPSSISETESTRILKKRAAKIKKQVDAVVVIGIGGSYLGTRAVAEALSHSFLHLKTEPEKPGHTVCRTQYRGRLSERTCWRSAERPEVCHCSDFKIGYHNRTSHCFQDSERIILKRKWVRQQPKT